jgi:hypothetical protein
LKEDLVDTYENLLYRIPWKPKSISKLSYLNEDEIFLDVFPIYQNLDNFLSSNQDMYRWSALRYAVRALRTVGQWSNTLSLSSLGDARQTLSKVRQVMTQRLVPTIASGDRTSLSTAKDAIENFLSVLVGSSKQDLRNIIATLQSLAFSPYP